MSKLSKSDETSLSKLRRISGNGCKFLSTGANTGLNAYCLVIQTEAEISAFIVDGTDQVSAYGLSGATLPAQAYIVVPDESSISSVTLASGTAIAYNL